MIWLKRLETKRNNRFTSSCTQSSHSYQNLWVPGSDILTQRRLGGYEVLIGSPPNFLTHTKSSKTPAVANRCPLCCHVKIVSLSVWDQVKHRGAPQRVGREEPRPAGASRNRPQTPISSFSTSQGQLASRRQHRKFVTSLCLVEQNASISRVGKKKKKKKSPIVHQVQLIWKVYSTLTVT